MTSFISILPVYGFQKNWKICVVLLYGSEILSKNWDIWNPKFQQNSTVYYFYFYFLAFLAFFFLFHVPNLCKNYRICCGILLEALEILLTISGKFSKFFLKKILICEIFFFKILRFTICFFIFFIVFNILFSISSICSYRKILEFFFYFVD